MEIQRFVDDFPVETMVNYVTWGFPHLFVCLPWVPNRNAGYLSILDGSKHLPYFVSSWLVLSWYILLYIYVTCMICPMV